MIGNRIWTTLSPITDWIFAIVRTSQFTRHAGLSPGGPAGKSRVYGNFEILDDARTVAMNLTRDGKATMKPRDLDFFHRFSFPLAVVAELAHRTNATVRSCDL